MSGKVLAYWVVLLSPFWGCFLYITPLWIPWACCWVNVFCQKTQKYTKTVCYFKRFQGHSVIKAETYSLLCSHPNCVQSCHLPGESELVSCCVWGWSSLEWVQFLLGSDVPHCWKFPGHIHTYHNNDSYDIEDEAHIANASWNNLRQICCQNPLLYMGKVEIQWYLREGGCVIREHPNFCFSRIPAGLSQLSGVHELQTNNQKDSSNVRDALYPESGNLRLLSLCKYHLRHGDFFSIKKILQVWLSWGGVYFEEYFFMPHLQDPFIFISPLSPRAVIWENFSRLLQGVFLVLCLCHVLLQFYECFRPCLK